MATAGVANLASVHVLSLGVGPQDDDMLSAIGGERKQLRHRSHSFFRLKKSTPQRSSERSSAGFARCNNIDAVVTQSVGQHLKLSRFPATVNSLKCNEFKLQLGLFPMGFSVPVISRIWRV